jgi:hypothetical protein
MEPHLFWTQELKRCMERTIANVNKYNIDCVVFHLDEEEIILTGMVQQWFPTYKVSKNAKNQVTVSWKE